MKDLIKQQAAVIEQMREALQAMVIYAREEGKGLRIADEALALQPCPEVLNKVRAEARRQALYDAAEDFEMGASVDDIRCNAQRIDYA